MLEQEKPFVKLRTDEEKALDNGRTEGIWLNNPERKQLERLATFFHQEKLSTTIKHCIKLSSAIIEGGGQMDAIRDIVYNNVRKNKRLGIEEVAPKFRIS